MPLIKFNAEFQEGEIVYFTFDEAVPYRVRGYIVRKEVILYILFNPELGEVEAFESEITRDRTIL